MQLAGTVLLNLWDHVNHACQAKIMHVPTLFSVFAKKNCLLQLAGTLIVPLNLWDHVNLAACCYIIYLVQCICNNIYYNWQELSY